MKKIALLILCLVAALPLGCGYSTSAILSSGHRTIAVEPFKNKILFTTDSSRTNYFPLLEVNIRNAVVDRFLFDGNLKVVNPDQADLILRGELLSYDRSVLRETGDQDVEEYRVHVTVSLVLWDPAEEKVVWEEPSFTGESTYFTTGSQAKSEAQGVADAVTDLARRVVERTIENW